MESCWENSVFMDLNEVKSIPHHCILHFDSAEC